MNFEFIFMQLPYHQTTLPNGLRLITVPMPSAHSVSVSVFLKAGSRLEEEPVNGLAHFLEHMVFKGTQKYPNQKEISEAVEGVGGILNAYTSEEEVCFWVKVTKDYFERGLEVLSELCCSPLIEEVQIEKERGVIIEEIRRYEDNPAVLILHKISEVFWGGNSLGRPILGSEENIKKMERKDFVNFRDQFYQTPSAVVAVAGNIDSEQISDLVAQYFLRLPHERKTEFQKVEEGQTKPAFGLYSRKTEQAHLCLGVRGLSYFSEDEPVLDVLNTVLGEGMSSRLWLEIREKKGLAYSIHSLSDSYAETGALIAHAGANITKIDQAIAAILLEFRRLKTEEVLDEELRQAKERIKGPFLFSLENTHAVAQFYGGQELLKEEIETPEEKIAKIEKVTSSDIRRVANEIFRPEKLNLALIGPFEDKIRFEKLLDL